MNLFKKIKIYLINFKGKKINSKNLDNDFYDSPNHTNKINIIMNSKKELKESQDYNNDNIIIYKNYDLATKKIISSYEEVLESGAYITTQYLAVQISLYLHEKKMNIKLIHKIINEFIEYTWKKISQGKNVAYTNEIIFESILYVNKIIPAISVTPSFANMVNAIKYDQLFLEMVSKNIMSPVYKEIIDVLIQAIEKNLDQGYYIQLISPIILKTEFSSSNNIVLFSRETLKEMNSIFRNHRHKKLDKEISISNAINHFQKAKDSIIEKESINSNDEIDKEEQVSNISFNKFQEEEKKRVEKITKDRKKQKNSILKKIKLTNKKEKNNVIN